MARKTWEIRVQGIRPQNCEFASFSDARAYCLRLISSHVMDLQRSGHVHADAAGRAESTFAHETARVAKERPLPNDAILVMPWRADVDKQFCISRLEPRMHGNRLKASFASYTHGKG